MYVGYRKQAPLPENKPSNSLFKYDLVIFNLPHLQLRYYCDLTTVFRDILRPSVFIVMGLVLFERVR